MYSCFPRVSNTAYTLGGYNGFFVAQTESLVGADLRQAIIFSRD